MTIHIASMPVVMHGRTRQVCAWCGELLYDSRAEPRRSQPWPAKAVIDVSRTLVVEPPAGYEKAYRELRGCLPLPSPVFGPGMLVYSTQMADDRWLCRCPEHPAQTQSVAVCMVCRTLRPERWDYEGAEQLWCCRCRIPAGAYHQEHAELRWLTQHECTTCGLSLPEGLRAAAVEEEKSE